MERILAPVGALCVIATVILGAWGWMDTGDSREVADRADRARRLERSCRDLVSASSTTDYVLRSAQAQVDPAVGLDPATVAYELPYLLDLLEQAGEELTGQARADLVLIRDAVRAIEMRFSTDGSFAGAGIDLTPLLAPEVREAHERLKAVARERCPGQFVGIELGPAVTIVPVDPDATSTVPGQPGPPPAPDPSSTTQPGG